MGSLGAIINRRMEAERASVHVQDGFRVLCLGESAMVTDGFSHHIVNVPSAVIAVARQTSTPYEGRHRHV